MRDVYSVEISRAAEFSDEESNTFTNEMAVPLASVALSNKTNIVSVNQSPSTSTEEDNKKTI